MPTMFSFLFAGQVMITAVDENILKTGMTWATVDPHMTCFGSIQLLYELNS